MVRTISQREFRNASTSVMDAVESGETVIVTRNGVAVAELRPVQSRMFVSTAELMRTFRELPSVDLGEMKSEADALLGEDSLDE